EDFINSALAITPEPLGTRVFVAEQSGRIFTLTASDEGLESKSLFMDIGSQVLSGQDSGLLGFAFHPEYNQVGSPNSTYFYLYYTHQREEGDFLRLSRFSGSATGNVGSELIMFEQQLGDMMHRGGGMLFGDDGFLYLAIGDLGWMTQSQNITDRLSGGVLRLDVDMQGGAVSHAPRRTLGDVAQGFSGVGYFIPSDNPFLDEAGGLFEEYYALGSRNPHRMTKDRATGIIYIGNVGANSGDKREEVNVLAKGANFGWPFREGTQDRPDLMAEPDNLAGTLTDPIHEYQHTSGDGCSIIGGYVYRGNKLPALTGQYLLTDYCSKKVWALNVAAGTSSVKTEVLSLPHNPITFGEDAAGELYVGVQGWHPVYKLVPGADSQELELPTLLSETGVFTDLAMLTPLQGVIPYKVIAPLWSDGAAKLRWMAIPNDGTHDSVGEQIIYSEEEEWGFPVGSVFIKHFELALDERNPSERRRLETRFLVHGEAGQFYAFTYRWNDAGTDASLLEASLEETFTITEADGATREQTWLYPSRSDCFVCHTSAAGRVLGPKTRQLNSTITYPSTGLAGNQIESLNHIGIFDPVVDLASLSTVLTSHNIADESIAVEERARAYLDANCAGCHRPDGGPRSTFDLRLNIGMEENGLIDGAVIEDLGIADAKVIVPGDPEKSILFQRLQQLGTSTAMPPLAKDRLDADAVALIRDWIIAMEPLPVTLTAFSGLVDGNTVQLTWTTASETNNAGFYVERLQAEGWFTLDFVSGQGTTLEKQHYSYTDLTIPDLADRVTYRLRQVDFDGTFEYSEAVDISILQVEVQLASNYPNPFNPVTTIVYQLPEAGDVQLTVYDMQGRRVKTLVDQRLPAGTHEVVFDAEGLASGAYLYELATPTTRLSKQMLFIK
ncbi:MAG: PQQ-dependent sugar dehydrogenase, partial [Bacteroidota bacterium]